MTKKTIYSCGVLNFLREYFNTIKEAQDYFRSQEEPERIEKVDPAEECNLLTQECEKLREERDAALYHIKELIAVASLELLRGTSEGRRALTYLRGVDPEFLDSCRL